MLVIFCHFWACLAPPPLLILFNSPFPSPPIFVKIFLFFFRPMAPCRRCSLVFNVFVSLWPYGRRRFPSLEPRFLGTDAFWELLVFSAFLRLGGDNAGGFFVFPETLFWATHGLYLG